MNLFGNNIDSTDNLQRQIACVLEKEIRSGRWKVGDRLPTVRELAEQSGVSTSPITRALSSLEKRGFLIQHVGRGTFLRSTNPGENSRTGVVAVVYGGARPGQKTSESEALDRDLLAAISEELSRQGHSVRVYHEAALNPEEDKPEMILASSPLQGAEGVLNLGSVGDTVLLQVQALGIPVVCVGDPFPPPGVPFVAGGVQQAVWEAVEIFYRTGHRKIGLAHTFVGLPSRIRRLHYEAFIGACSEFGLKVEDEWIVDAGPRYDVDIGALKDFLLSNTKPTAVVCTHNNIAQVIVNLAPLMDIQIPEEISVLLMTGNLDFGDTFDPPLSALVIPIATYAKKAVTHLLGMIEYGELRGNGGVLIGPVRKMRGSIGVPRKEGVSAVV